MININLLKKRAKLYPLIHKNELLYFYYEKYRQLKLKRDLKINDVDYVKQIYLKKTGLELNLKKPETFDEKLQFLKLSNRDPLLTKCTDKFLVRDYVKKCGLENILVELYGIFENAKDINFDLLLSPCIIKINHGYNCNAIFDKNLPFNKKAFIRKFNNALNHNYYLDEREWNYKNIKPKIICEKLLQASEGNHIADLNFYCFNGEPELIMYNIGLSDETGLRKKGKRFVVDKYFNIIKLKTIMEPYEGKIVKPSNFEVMLDYARILSKPFNFVRVDLYNAENVVYFGELTFYPGGGIVYFEPTDWLAKFAELTDVSKYSIASDALSSDINR